MTTTAMQMRHDELCQDAERRSSVLCRYFFQQMMLETNDEPWEPHTSSLLLSNRPTLRELQVRFPFQGTFHFRARRQLAPSQYQYCWVDLVDAEMELPVVRGEVWIKVLHVASLSSSKSKSKSNNKNSDTQVVDPHEDQAFDAFFRRQYEREAAMHAHRNRNQTSNGSAPTGTGVQEVGAVLSGVKKALANKMKQTVLGQTLQKQSARVWEKVMAATNAGASAPPSAAALTQLATLASALTTPVSDQDQEHVDLLHRLWMGCFDTAQAFVVRGAPWRRLGFGYDDLLRELPCLLPLQCLVFFHEVHRQISYPMLTTQASLAPPDAYPYGAVSIQIVMLLADMLQLREGAFVGVERPFWRLFESPIALFELFAVTMRAFDSSWRANGLQPGNVGFHLERASAFAEQVLRRGPDSVTMLVDLAHQLQQW